MNLMNITWIIKYVHLDVNSGPLGSRGRSAFEKLFSFSMAFVQNRFSGHFGHAASIEFRTRAYQIHLFSVIDVLFWANLIESYAAAVDLSFDLEFKECGCTAVVLVLRFLKRRICHFIFHSQKLTEKSAQLEILLFTY